MRAKEARGVSITRFLELWGCKPARVRRGGRELWYSSPIRSGDTTPSFKVDVGLNVWFDHGLGQGGTLIDLVCELKSIDVAGALRIIEQTGLAPQRLEHRAMEHQVRSACDAPRLFGSSRPAGTQFAGEKERELPDLHSAPSTQVLAVRDVQHPALLDYLAKRAIDLGIARRYLRQVHFRPASGVRQYFALGFPSGKGFDARSSLFKGFVGSSKDVSLVEGAYGSGPSKARVAVFEGFMDFLSLLTLRGVSALPCDVIILHSVALKSRCLTHIQSGGYKNVSLYLDNDPMGRATTRWFVNELGSERVRDEASLYEGNKDLNDHLMACGTSSKHQTNHEL